MTIPKDMAFGLDSFQQPKVLNEVESIAQYILNVLMWKPGTLPGLPHIGINIREMLYTFVDDFQPEVLKTKIENQCNELMPNLLTSNIAIAPVEYDGKEFFVLIIPVVVNGESHNISYAFFNDSNNQFTVGYEIDQL